MRASIFSDSFLCGSDLAGVPLTVFGTREDSEWDKRFAKREKEADHRSLWASTSCSSTGKMRVRCSPPRLSGVAADFNSTDEPIKRRCIALRLTTSCP